MFVEGAREGGSGTFVVLAVACLLGGKVWTWKGMGMGMVSKMPIRGYSTG